MNYYHGPKPVTKADAKLAKKHLKETIKVKKEVVKVNESKMAEHQKAAKSTSNSQSRSYNMGHIAPHRREAASARKEITQRKQSLKTLSKLKFISG